jgi:hypothetical protein
VAAFCSQEQFKADTCPADSTIGSVQVTAKCMARPEDRPPPGRSALVRLNITDTRDHTTAIKKRVRVRGKIPERR